MDFKIDSTRAKQLAAKYALHVSFEIRPIKKEGWDARGFALYTVEVGHASDLARLMVEAGEPDFISGVVGPLWAVLSGWDPKVSSVDLPAWDHRFKIGYRMPTP